LTAKIGYNKPDGFLEFKLSSFVAQMGVKPAKARTVFKLLDQNGYLQFFNAFAGKSTRVIGDLGMVDFKFLHSLYLDKLDKLKQVREYMRVPDEKKHDYLQDYFLKP
jgi:hypothetical protein